MALTGHKVGQVNALPILKLDKNDFIEGALSEIMR
jgi:hypothetical protein